MQDNNFKTILKGSRLVSPAPDSKPPKPSKQESFQLAWQYRGLLLKYKWRLLIGFIALIITNSLGVMIPWLIKQTINRLNTGLFFSDKERFFWESLGLILGISFVVLIVRVLSRQMILGIGRILEFELRNKLYAKILTMPPSYFAVNPTGELMSRMTNDVTAIRYMTGGGVMLLLNAFLAYLTSVPMMWGISPALTLSALVVFPLGILGLKQLIPHIQQHYLKVQEILGEMSTLTQENFSGIRVIQSFAKEKTEARRFLGYCKRYLAAFIKLVDVRVWMVLVVVMMSGFSTLFILAIGGYQVITQEINLGGYVAFTLYLERLAWPTMAFGWALSTFNQGLVSLGRIHGVLSTPSSISDANVTENIESTVSSENHLEIRHLNFQYVNPYQALLEIPSEPSLNKPFQLTDINLSIPGGQTVALVGPVGSGKSTLLSIFARLVEVPENSVFLDNIDISQMPLKTLRSHIGFMPQSSFLFSTSVQENIRLGQPEASRDTVERFANIVQMHPEIMNFPDQYNTLVGERGVILSGGQKQRLALARTLLIEPDILILDDPFSHLDAISEANIIETLKQRKTFGNRTTIFSTNRFALLEHADTIVLMNEGKIVAQGSHQALLQNEPLYRQLNQVNALLEESI
jgi:ATP-binding cassette, subfamily B, multidrug efflux pump